MQEGGGSGSGLTRDETGNVIEESEQVKKLRKPSTPSAAERKCGFGSKRNIFVL